MCKGLNENSFLTCTPSLDQLLNNNNPHQSTKHKGAGGRLQKVIEYSCLEKIKRSYICSVNFLSN